MTRLGTLFWVMLVLASGFTTFKVKYAVQDIEDELHRVRKQTVVEQQEIRVLNAEWTYLNEPERLADLNRRFLQLGPVAPKQLQQKIDDIPLRPAPPPDTIVAANPDSPAQAELGVPSASPVPTALVAPVAPAAIPHGPAAIPAVAVSSRPAATVPATAASPRPPAVTATASSAKPGRLAAANSLDALIAQIADSR